MVGRRLISFCASLVVSTCIVAILYALITDSTFHYFSLVCLIPHYVFFVFFAYHMCSRWICGGKIQPISKAVFITGCDTGFGNELAKRLDGRGFQVFAGCLFPEAQGAAGLKKCCSDRLHVLYLDVTKNESIEKAVEFVGQNLGTAELWALVNNAGIFKGLAIELTSIDAFRESMEVNSLGPVRVTKAFLPLLKKSKGRVINVNSVSGRVCLLNTCAYSMSKYAAVAFTEILGLEMEAWGVQVISIEPEAFRTCLTEKQKMLAGFDEELKKIREDVFNAYGEKYVEDMKQSSISYLDLLPLRFHRVTDAMESAIMDEYPNLVYKPRWNFISRLCWDLVEIILPRGMFKYVLLKAMVFCRCPVPEGTKKYHTNG